MVIFQVRLTKKGGFFFEKRSPFFVGRQRFTAVSVLCAGDVEVDLLVPLELDLEGDLLDAVFDAELAFFSGVEARIEAVALAAGVVLPEIPVCVLVRERDLSADPEGGLGAAAQAEVADLSVGVREPDGGVDAAIKIDRAQVGADQIIEIEQDRALESEELTLDAGPGVSPGSGTWASAPARSWHGLW